MAEIPSIHPAGGVRPVQPRASSPAARPQPAASEADTVEISPQARLASLLSRIPEVRADLIARVKAQIDAGTYETPEKLDAAIDRLMDELIP